MGNQQSAETMPASPIISRLLKSLNMELQKQRLTSSLSHHHFAIDFYRTDSSKFDRSMNPFCPLTFRHSQNWMTCCIISPLMAITSPLSILNKNGSYNNKCQILPVCKDLISSVPICDAIQIVRQNLCLIVFEKPYWKVGWAGISYVKDTQELMVLQMKYVNHPQTALYKQDNRMIHIQQVKRFKIPKKSRLNNQFIIQSNGSIGSLICKIVEKKPYLIGIQITGEQILFFNESTFSKIREQAKSYIKQRGQQKQILKQIDIREFQIQTEL